MLCQKCKKNEANVFYRENVNGKSKNYALCSECAKELEEKGEINTGVGGFFDMPAFGLPALDPAEFFGTLFGALSPASAVSSGSESRRCPVCGSTFRDFYNSGKVGCPTCYSEFSRELESTVNRIHGDALHRGRTPKAWKQKLDTDRQIKALKKELSDAVKAEEFERAAELRDRIRTLESGK